jgi:hypothetical protein
MLMHVDTRTTRWLYLAQGPLVECCIVKKEKKRDCQFFLNCQSSMCKLCYTLSDNNDFIDIIIEISVYIIIFHYLL